VIRGRLRDTQSLSSIARGPNNIAFDLRNFGFIPERKKEILKIYDDIIFVGNVQVLQPYECKDLLQKENFEPRML